MSSKKIVYFFSKPCLWYFIAAILLALCIDIELEWLLLPCKSKEVASAVNRIILALSYSYIAAAIFHTLVIYLPNRKRCAATIPFLNSKLLDLCELFRQCKQIAIPSFDFCNKKYSKDEYCQMFSNTDFYEDDDFCKGQSKYVKLESLRSNIISIVTILLSYRELLSDEYFNYLIYVMNSTFVNKGLYPYKEESNNYYCNQDEIGSCIFDLYEESRKIVSSIHQQH